MPTSNFVTAWRKDTGEKVRIPEHWVDHPTLSEPFTTTEPKAEPATPTLAPSGRAATKAATAAKED